jgi:TetR/AcrR family transcriptional repressor of mexJK operon
MSRQAFLDRRAATKRRAILDAATARFAADGYEGTRVERIAAEAAVSTATLYRYFPSKLALLEAVLRDGVESFPAAMDLPPGAPAEAQLLAVARPFAALFVRDETIGLLRTVLAAAPAAPEVSAIFLEAAKARVAAGFVGAVARSVEGGELALGDVPIETAAGQLMGLIEHALFWGRLLAPGASHRDAESVALESVTMFCRAYRAAGRRAAP